MCHGCSNDQMLLVALADRRSQTMLALATVVFPGRDMGQESGTRTRVAAHVHFGAHHNVGGLSYGLPSALRRAIQRRFMARPPSRMASLLPMVLVPQGVGRVLRVTQIRQHAHAAA